jgi:uncharacterized membrane protein (Fun14 family)
LAASKGYIDIKWKKVERDVLLHVDPNGDGSVSKAQLKVLFDKAMKVLKYNLPSSSGFAVGFLLGLTYA